jgi:streptogramin lyase
VYSAPPVVKTEIFARVPERFRAKENVRLQSGIARDCFLEGPSFDRDGNLYVTNIPYGQIFKISPAAEFALVASYDGEPNGFKIHKDGRIFIADHKQGLMLLDPLSGKVECSSTGRAANASRGSTIWCSPRTAISISPIRARAGCTIRLGVSTAGELTADSSCCSTMCRARTGWC